MLLYMLGNIILCTIIRVIPIGDNPIIAQRQLNYDHIISPSYVKHERILYIS